MKDENNNAQSTRIAMIGVGSLNWKIRSRYSKPDGRGLWLYITYEVLKKNGGSIESLPYAGISPKANPSRSQLAQQQDSCSDNDMAKGPALIRHGGIYSMLGCPCHHPLS